MLLPATLYLTVAICGLAAGWLAAVAIAVLGALQCPYSATVRYWGTAVPLMSLSAVHYAALSGCAAIAHARHRPRMLRPLALGQLVTAIATRG